MKNRNSDDPLQRNSVPILSWDFHYEYLNELKALSTDLKRVSEISDEFIWDEKTLNIQERIKNEVVLITDLDLKIVFASSGIKKMTG